MKRIYIILAGLLFILNSCSDQLDTYPSDKVPDEMIFANAEAAQIAMNGIYRAMFMPSTMWSTNWSSENPGIMTLTLVKDLHGEDHLQANQGQGWFFFDYAFGVDGDFSTTSGRQYAQWKMYYTYISQANYIIDAEEKLKGFGPVGENVLAQAYATRAFAYTCLYEWFCKGNYKANQDAPGVPIYTTATTPSTEGTPRGTVADVFERINKDFETAVALFKESGIEREHDSHLDLYTTYGLWARVALIQENWDNAGKYANAALGKSGLVPVASMSEIEGLNDLNAPNVLWGFEVLSDQSGPYAYFLSHVDPEGGYGDRAQQCIDKWLWNQIPDTDERKTKWWDSEKDPQYFPFIQLKYRYSNISTYVGDQIYLRAEEMVLIAAEAACMKGNYAEARALLAELGNKRDSQYEARLNARTNSTAYNTDTHGDFITLRDEILFQRRVELWCEGLGRAFDLRRLNLGYTRNYEGTNHPNSALRTLEPGDNRFVTLIPQREIDSNNSITIADQNPR